jgi:hypothetical protein
LIRIDKKRLECALELELFAFAYRQQGARHLCHLVIDVHLVQGEALERQNLQAGQRVESLENGNNKDKIIILY